MPVTHIRHWSARRTALHAGAAALALAVGLVAPAAARDSGEQTAQATAAQYSFDLPSKPLAQALDDVGRITGLAVVYTLDDPARLTAPALAGRMSADQALRRLLEGSGLVHRYTGPSTVTLDKVAAGGALLLGPVTVEGAGQRRVETAVGPVDGYVATRSASATKSDLPILRTPQSLSVVTRDQMDTQGVQRVEQALRYTPGATVELFGPENRGDTMFLRGFANDTHLNGLLLQGGTGYSSWTMEPYGLERVEVVRGPSSVIYGKTSPGGVVNQVSKRPTAEPLREVTGGLGSFDRYQAAFDLAGAANDSGTVLYRLTGLGRDSGTQVEQADESRLFLAPALSFRLGEDTNLTLLTQAQRNESGNTVGFLPAQGTLYRTRHGRIPPERFVGEPDFDRYDTDQYMAAYEVDHTVRDGLTLRQKARWTRLDLDYRTLYASGLQADQRTLARTALANEDSTDAAMIDSQAEITLAHDLFRHQILLGLDHQSSWADSKTGFGAAPSIDIFNPVYGAAVTAPAWSSQTEQTLHQTGIYAQDAITIAERWTLLLSGRQDWSRSENQDTLAGGPAATKNDSAFSGRAGLTYEFAFGLAPYASYAESFAPTTVTGADGQVLDPETAHQWEVGVKYQPPGWNSFLSAALFDLRRENLITYDAVTWTASQTGETRSRGVELEAKLALAEGLNVLAAYTYQDVEILKTTAGTTGKRPMAIPARMASLWADYTVPQGDFAGLGLGAGVRHTGSSYGDAMNTFSVDSFTLVDAEVSYEAGAYRFGVNASNLFDKEYVASCWGSCYYGTGRTVLATMRYRW